MPDLEHSMQDLATLYPIQLPANTQVIAWVPATIWETHY